MWWRLSRVNGGGTSSNDCIEVGRTIYRRELQGAKEAAVALLHKAPCTRDQNTRVGGLVEVKVSWMDQEIAPDDVL